MIEVLVIDDDSNIHALLKVALSELEMHGTYVLNGEEGLARIRQYYSDIVLLDINLPGKSGTQILRQLRADPLLKNMTIVMLTASRDRETLLECARLGITDYIAKPFELTRLIAKLSMIARNLSIEREQAKTQGISHIKMERLPGVVQLTFLGAISEKTVEQFKNLYTTTFAMMTKSDAFILNFRVLPDLDAKQISWIDAMDRMLAPKKPLFIGGRNYGTLVTAIEDFETRLFVIEEDAFEFLSLVR